MDPDITDVPYGRFGLESPLLRVVLLALVLFTGGCGLLDWITNPAREELRLAVFPPSPMSSDIQQVPDGYTWEEFQGLGVLSSPALRDWRGRMELCAFLASGEEVLRNRCSDPVRTNDDDLVGGGYFRNLLGRDPLPFLSDWAPLSDWSMTLLLNDQLNYIELDPGRLAEALRALESPDNGERIVGFYARITQFEGDEYSTVAKPFGVVIRPRP